MLNKIQIFLIFLSQFFIHSGELYSYCSGEFSGPIRVKITQCQTIEPLSYLQSNALLPTHFFKTYPRKKALSAIRSHAGSVVQALVIDSQTVDPSLNDSQALLGESIEFFVPSQLGNCNNHLAVKQIVTGKIQSHCCKESIDSPCLFSSNLTFAPIKVLVKKNKLPDQKNIKIPEIVSSARSQLRKKQFSTSVVSYLKAEKEGNTLSTFDQYLMALSLYLDEKQCERAIPRLEKVRASFQDYNAAILPKFAKRSFLLLARCYAVQRKSDQANTILFELLDQAEYFEDELSVAMHHIDFGWINTSAGYLNFQRRQSSRLRPSKVLP